MQSFHHCASAHKAENGAQLENTNLPSLKISNSIWVAACGYCFIELRLMTTILSKNTPKYDIGYKRRSYKK